MVLALDVKTQFYHLYSSKNLSKYLLIISISRSTVSEKLANRGIAGLSNGKGGGFQTTQKPPSGPAYVPDLTCLLPPSPSSVNCQVIRLHLSPACAVAQERRLQAPMV